MNYDLNNIQEVISHLTNVGYVNDEHTSLGTRAFDQDHEKLVADLREMGFHEEIEFGAYTRDSGSTIYWMCLIGTRDNAKRLSREWAAEHPD